MKNVSKKVICALSSAVLLCGASAIPASAKELPGIDPSIGRGRLRPEHVDIIHIDPNWRPSNEHIYFDFYEALSAKQKKTLVFMPDSGRAVLEVEVSGGRYRNDSDYEIRYQWCDENGPIYGAMNSIYYASRTGSYYCCVWEAKKNEKREVYYPYDAVKSDTATVVKGMLIAGISDNSFKREAVFQEIKRAS